MPVIANLFGTPERVAAGFGVRLSRIRELGELLAALRAIIKAEKMSVILVEQSARKILPLTDRAVILERGAVAWSGASEALLADREALAGLLAVAEKK